MSIVYLPHIFVRNRLNIFYISDILDTQWFINNFTELIFYKIKYIRSTMFQNQSSSEFLIAHDNFWTKILIYFAIGCLSIFGERDILSWTFRYPSNFKYFVYYSFFYDTERPHKFSHPRLCVYSSIKSLNELSLTENIVVR